MGTAQPAPYSTVVTAPTWVPPAIITPGSRTQLVASDTWEEASAKGKGEPTSTSNPEVYQMAVRLRRRDRELRRGALGRPKKGATEARTKVAEHCARLILMPHYQQPI